MGLTLEPLHIGRDRTLPEGAAGLFLSGLLDEDGLAAFAGNDALKTNLAAAIDGGLPTLALGGGALLLLRRLADSHGRTHELAGVLPAEAELLEWYERPRYVHAVAARENRYAEGETTLYELFDLEFLTLQQEAFAWRVGEPGDEGQVEGFVHERCLATTLVPSLPATPGPGRRLRRRDATGGAGRVSLAALETWLRTRRGLLVLWLTTTAAVALVTLLMERGGVPGWDDAAHAYKVFLLRNGGSIFWDTYWYGGGYGAITYGFVFYWLAQYVSGALIVIVAAGTLPVTFYLYVRDLWKIDDVWPAWGFALVMALYLAHGQDPFVLALALTMGGLALLARRRPLWAALPVAVGIFANPMGLVVVVPFMVTDFIVRPGCGGATSCSLLPQPLVVAHGQVETGRGEHEGDGLARARVRGREHGVRRRLGVAKPRAEGARLGAAALRERDVHVALLDLDHREARALGALARHVAGALAVAQEPELRRHARAYRLGVGAVESPSRRPSVIPVRSLWSCVIAVLRSRSGRS